LKENTLPFVFLLLSIACWRSLEQGYGVSWREEINILAIFLLICLDSWGKSWVINESYDICNRDWILESSSSNKELKQDLVQC
jgi:hypothetical protein